MAAAEQRQRGEMSQADAEQMLQLKTMKITMGSSKAKRNEAMARKVREAQRRLKGVKLQHTGNDDAVGFDDVAGIGEAKVGVVGCTLYMYCMYGLCICYIYTPHTHTIHTNNTPHAQYIHTLHA